MEKEYNEHGNLIYEGEYLYGSKRFGNMYMNDRLEFKGEFLFDKKFNGKGFDENGKVIYELNKGTGKIKEYDYYKGFLLYEGEYLNGRRNGKGKEYNEHGNLIYEGEYLYGRRNGREKNIILMENWNMKENIYQIKNGLENFLMKMVK